jgi:hypothetical protein
VLYHTACHTTSNVVLYAQSQTALENAMNDPIARESDDSQTEAGALTIAAVLLTRRNEIKAALKRLDQQLIEAKQRLDECERVIALERRPLSDALEHLDAFLRLEGYDPPDEPSTVVETSRVSSESITDAALALLEHRRHPLHYKEIAAVLSETLLIPGRDPAATLLTRMSRDSRFKRGPTRGTYALAHWRIPGKLMRSPRRRRS